jgi:NAD+ diphosphatase
MQLDLTFSGGGLDRAAQMRNDVAALAAARADINARGMVMWRGKPLLQLDDAGCSLVLLPMDHPVLSDATSDPIFMGLTPAPVFAFDISDWAPAALDDAALASFADPSRQHHPALPEDQQFCELRLHMMQLTPLDAELVATAKALLHWHARHGFCSACGARSDMAAAGWQRNCPACKAPHFPRTDPVVIMLITDGPRVLLGRSHGWPDGMYSLPAGFIEPGETVEAAVRREVLEETGIRVGDVTYLASQPWAFPASLMIGCAGRAISRDITVDPDELEDALWLDKDGLMLAFAGAHPQIKPARKGAIAHYILHGWLSGHFGMT